MTTQPSTPTTTPVTGTPLDYVPIDAPVLAHKPTVFSSPTLRRAITAGAVAALAAGMVFIPSVAVGFVAIIAMVGTVFVSNKLADRANARDG